ncbi:MAG: hypothetical protein KA099_08685 [Alphaproteobacteria bacterium]|nr:hypothetical protein [Alphaproteobacteria bacterium]MBP7759363.1 hypothetical protein [Alphaproteobacteria bacterium]MBP7762576.1 hypothetical protein [Alphaproteobacteria bacterium]MBP7905385.1 hypothetical protein [Alphaproteobacteria bacterium]
MGWLGNAWDKVSGAVVSVASAAVSSETYVKAWDGVKSGANWVNEKAIQPAAKWVGDNAPKLLEAQTWKNAGSAVVDYGKFVVNNPLLAARQAGQGLSNSVTGLGALVVDIGRWGVEGTYHLAHNTFVGAVNLGADKDKNILEYRKMSDFNVVQKWVEDKTGHYLGYTREELNQMVRDGKITERDASYAAGTKYGFQAIGEVGSIVLVSALTAGAGGVALGSLRGGALGVRAVAVGEALAETGRLGQIAAKPLYWFGRNPTVSYLERAATLAAEAPKPGVVGTVMRGPLRVFDPAQTEHAFASWMGSKPLFQNHITLANGLRAAEGGFKWTNPLQANGRSVVAWSIEGAGATMSYTVNSAKENEQVRKADAARTYASGVVEQENSDEANRKRYYDSLRERGIDPSMAPTYEQAMSGQFSVQTGPPAAPSPSDSATQQPLRQEFQSNAPKDEGITHVFTIEGFEGLKQPTQLDPLSQQGTPAQPRQPAPVTPGMGNGNR